MCGAAAACGEAVALGRALAARTAELASLRREFRHRTRNDLQVLVSMLRMRAAEAPTADARDALAAVARAVGALSHVHDLIGEAMPEPDDPVDTGLFLVALCRRIGARAGAIEAHSVPHTVARPLGHAAADLASAGPSSAGPSPGASPATVAFRRDGARYVLRVERGGAPPPAGADGRVARGLARSLGGELACGEAWCEIRFPAGAP